MLFGRAIGFVRVIGPFGSFNFIGTMRFAENGMGIGCGRGISYGREFNTFTFRVRGGEVRMTGERGEGRGGDHGRCKRHICH